MNNEPVGTVIETEEIYGHTFKKRKSKRVQLLKEVDVGTLLYVNPSKEDEGKVCARCGAIAYDPVIKQTVKELTDEEIYRLLADSIWAVGLNTDCLDEQNWADGITVARAILRKAQENG